MSADTVTTGGVVRRFVLGGVVLGCLIGLTSCASTPGETGRADASGQTVDGARYEFVAGRPTLFVFWASWCASCRREAPNLVALDALPELDVVGVNIDLDRTDAATAIGELGLTYPSIHDPDLVVWDSFSVSATPTLVLVDGEGTMVKRTNSTHYLPRSYVAQMPTPEAR